MVRQEPYTVTFLAQRWAASCQLFNYQALTNIAAPIHLRTDPGSGIVTAASNDSASLNSDIASIAGSLDSNTRICSN